MYKIGDKVIIRDWHEVAKERGQEKGKIYCEAHCVYDFSMNDYAGERAVIEEVQEYKNSGENWYRLASGSGELLPYHWTDSMLVRRDVSMAEEKFADRPQIQKGDIIRVVGEFSKEESCHVVSAVRDTGVYSDHPNYHYNEEILAVYRFDGRDFKCVWESVGYQFDRFKRIIDGINKTQLTLSVKLKSVNGAMEKLAKETGDDKHGSE